MLYEKDITIHDYCILVVHFVLGYLLLIVSSLRFMLCILRHSLHLKARNGLNMKFECYKYKTILKV